MTDMHHENPSETGARSGSYTTPKSENDEYTPPDEDDNSEKLPWYVWRFLFLLFLFLLLQLVLLTSNLVTEDRWKNPSEWPSVEGTIEYARVEDKFITKNIVKTEMMMDILTTMSAGKTLFTSLKYLTSTLSRTRVMQMTKKVGKVIFMEKL